MTRALGLALALALGALAACSPGDGASGAAASGAGGAASGSSTGTDAAAGGAGGDEGCATASTCGSATACLGYACVSGKCEAVPVAAGTEALEGSKLGDCKRQECDGKGEIGTVDDDADVPNDWSPCTDDGCLQGSPTHVAVDDGISCGSKPNLVCMGGQCTGCTTDNECPQGDTCMRAVCDKGMGGGGKNGVCGFEITAGVELADSDATDCLHAVCDELGAVVVAPDPDDVPPQDDSLCDAEVCDARGMVVHMALADGAYCDGGDFCNPSQCTGDVCMKQQPAPDGAVVPDQVGVCVLQVCDGNGGMKTAPAAAGTACSALPGGVCNDAGQCCAGFTCV